MAILALFALGPARIGRAQIAEENLPAANLPAAAPSTMSAAPNATPVEEGSSTDWERVPAGQPSSANEPPQPASSVSAQTQPPAAEPIASVKTPSARPAPLAIPPDVAQTPVAAATASSAAQATAIPEAVASAPPAALDPAAMNIGPDLGTASLEPEVKQAATPARAAALRLTEKARTELLKGGTNSALQDLGRAVSIDPGNPFEYYYLGRVYLTRHNLAQAVTFFHRAELGFAGRPDWLAETLSFAGACNEQLGRTSEAFAAYRRAVALAPGNFRAQVGQARLAPSVGAVTGLDEPPPSDQAAAPPPAAPAPLPAPDEAPALPPADIRN